MPSASLLGRGATEGRGGDGKRHLWSARHGWVASTDARKPSVRVCVSTSDRKPCGSAESSGQFLTSDCTLLSPLPSVLVAQVSGQRVAEQRRGPRVPYCITSPLPLPPVPPEVAAAPCGARAAAGARAGRGPPGPQSVWGRRAQISPSASQGTIFT